MESKPQSLEEVVATISQKENKLPQLIQNMSEIPESSIFSEEVNHVLNKLSEDISLFELVEWMNEASESINFRNVLTNGVERDLNKLHFFNENLQKLEALPSASVDFI